MAHNRPVSPATFQAIKNVDIDQLSELTDLQLRPILSCLVRMSLCSSLDTSDRWTQERKKILKCLSGIEVVNNLVGLLSIDFHALEQDARKEQQMRAKLGGPQTESIFISQLQQSVALEFERSDAAHKLRLLLSELLFVMSQIKEPRTEFYQKSSELFDNEVYLEEVSDVLCISQAELPSLLPMTEVAEALLHVPNGVWLLCRLVSNVPDSFSEVVTHLVSTGEKQDEEGLGGERRAQAILSLCRMNPSQIMPVRALCVKHCRMPGLAVALTLENKKREISETLQEVGSNGASNGMPAGLHSDISDVVAFISGLLLGNDIKVRNWFAQFIRIGQKKKEEPTSSILHTLRDELLNELMNVLPDGASQVTERQAVQGCAFIRLYCALKGIASLRFSEEEVKLLLKLITSNPPYTPSGVRFVSLGLCMLLACPYLIGSPDQEKSAIEWIKWLLREVGRFEKVGGESDSFGEMLLLIAIHFHSNQTTAIADLVCSTLGMKSAVKANSLARMKTIFTQEIFTEKVVTSHAVRVSVTQNLNTTMTGYLPIHCIYQLLKSRAFSKHKVPIKEWIYKQLCHCKRPVHGLLPPLIEVYIQSIILPSTKVDRTNEPITEAEILSVFSDSVYTRHRSRSRSFGKRKEEAMEVDGGESPENRLTSQLLLLYYVLLYQDTLLSNMKNIAAANRKVFSYPGSLMAQLPIKHLLTQAQKEQQLYAGLFSPLLRLVATHYPHLCLVEDWLDEELGVAKSSLSIIKVPSIICTPDSLNGEYQKLTRNPSTLLLLLDQLLTKSPNDLLPFAEVVTGNLRCLLDTGVPRKVQENVARIWVSLNTIIPRKLRVMTVNALRPQQDGLYRIPPYSEDDITLDPLILLRCDERVFRCPPLLQINLRILEAFLYASRTYLNEHTQANPINSEKPGGVAQIQEQEELKNALIGAQEGAAVQMLLEICLPTDTDKRSKGLLGDLREVQCIVCSRLHQMFISDPNLAKLVHFQGYPCELLPITVAGIPSMHICLDFIPELLSQPHLDKQIFAIELVSHLSLQYALRKAMGIAKLALSVMTTLIGVLSQQTRAEFFLPTLPAVVRICRAFPPLAEDAVSLLTQLGRVASAHLANADNALVQELPGGEPDDSVLPRHGQLQPRRDTEQLVLKQHRELLAATHRTFSDIVGATALLKPLNMPT